LKRIILITAGYASLSIGTLGIFLPVLPTTPFLLLAAACFLKSSKRLYKWITQHKLFGAYIKSYMKYRAISLKAKVISIFFLWLVIGVTVLFIIDFVWLKILLPVIAVGVTIYISSLRTLTEDMVDKFKNNLN
jgi:uncharacterized membrane protein YbaN (DUF454 family)